MADIDQFFGGAPATLGPPPGQLPTADQFFGPSGGASPSLPPPQSGAAQDSIWSSVASAGGRILNAANMGGQSAWGAYPDTLEAQTESALNKAGMLRDYTDKRVQFFKSISDAIMRPAVSAAAMADTVIRAPQTAAGLVGGGLHQAAIEVGGDETPQPQPSTVRSVLAAPLEAGSELAEGFLSGFGGELPAEGATGASRLGEAERTGEASQARSVGVIGEGEAGYYDVEPPTPENTEARAEAAKDVGTTPSPVPAPPPDIHALARKIDPDTFDQYDALAADRQVHAETLKRLGAEREASPEVAGAKAEIDDILGIERGTERDGDFAGRMAAFAASAPDTELARLDAAMDRFDRAMSADTPEMIEARNGLMQTDFAMRDLAPDVSEAYRAAREIAPNLPEDAAVAATEAQGVGKGAGAPEETPGQPKPEAGAQAAEPPHGAPAEGEGAIPAPERVGASPEGEAAVAPPNVLGEELGAASPGAAEGEATAAAENDEGSIVSNRAIGNPRAVQGTGEMVTRGLSREVEASAVENELTSSFGELPEYQRLNMKEQAAKAVDFMDKDYEAAKAVAMGRRQPPSDLHPASVAVAVEKRATAEGDVETLRQLANSPLATRVTTAAQTIRILGERDKGSPLAAIQELQQARESEFAKTGDIETAKAQTTEEIRSEVRSAASKPEAWKSFLESIQCGE